MGMIPLNNVHYYYEQQGKGEPIIFIAGYSCDHTFWNAITDEFAKRFTIVTFDNRAVGQTRDNGSPFTLEMMADESIQLIRALGMNKATIVGQSMGGIIAQIIAKKDPQLINKLIILNSAITINARTSLVLKMFVKLLQEQAPIETVIEASLPWFFSPHFLENEKNISAFKTLLMSNPYPQTLIDLERQLKALTQFDANQWKQFILAPTLVVAAQDDIICLPEESQLIKQYVPHVKFSTISGGHSSPIENPVGVISAISPFLE